MKNLIFFLLPIFLIQCKPKEDNTITKLPGNPEVPSSIKKVHVSLLQQIQKMTLYKDSSAQVARKLDSLLQHHFKEEEDFILPILGLLPALEKDQIPEKSKELIIFSENIKTMMTHMSVEHQLITAFIEELKQASSTEHKAEITEFEKEVQQHALSEEEVYFPAAIMVGKYLKIKENF